MRDRFLSYLFPLTSDQAIQHSAHLAGKKHAKHSNVCPAEQSCILMITHYYCGYVSMGVLMSIPSRST